MDFGSLMQPLSVPSKMANLIMNDQLSQFANQASLELALTSQPELLRSLEEHFPGATVLWDPGMRVAYLEYVEADGQRKSFSFREVSELHQLLDSEALETNEYSAIDLLRLGAWVRQAVQG